MVFIPSIVCMVVPLIILTFTMKGQVERPATHDCADSAHAPVDTSKRLKIFILFLGVSALLFVPVFKTLTHLPPYLGMLFGLSILWITTELLHRARKEKKRPNLQVTSILTRIDTPTILFFLGILLAVASLQSAGQLRILAEALDNSLGNIFLIDLAIGILSSVVDNVPLVAGAMGMYPIEAAGATGYAANFVQDGLFWEFLAYCAGTGGSILIIGSAAGVAAMGMEKIDFIWYLKRISLLALIGYLAGAATYYGQSLLIH
jgi:Na+/H+ antiporter NhaD/arsenite permease-like protein